MAALFNIFLLKSFLIASFIIFFFSCAKEQPYEEVFKEDEVLSKSLISTKQNPGKAVTYNKLVEGDNPEAPLIKGLEETIADDVYLYIPTVETGSYYSAQVMPYHVGDEKLVKFEFTQDSLKIIGHERDTRFRGVNSGKPIIEIPVEHLDFKCRENSNNECSNEEEENRDISWKDKKYVELQFSQLKVTNFDTAAGVYNELINQIYKCNTVEGVSVKSWSITEDTVDIVVEKTMRTSLYCMNLRTSSFSDQSYKINHRYFFKKLNSIASPDYKPALYARDDESAFGFFKSGFKTLSADNQELYYSEKIFMNRFNPKKKTITYYLSENHFSPEFAGILKATKQAIAVVNNGLSQAGTGMKIELSTKSREEVPQKLANSIIMVKEPFKAGPLGYGPSVKNPLNGEILMGQTVMYYGNMLWTIRSAYNDLLRAGSTIQIQPKQVNNHNHDEDNRPAKKSVSFNEEIKNFQEDQFLELVWADKGFDFEQGTMNEFFHAYDQIRLDKYLDTLKGGDQLRTTLFQKDFNDLLRIDDLYSENNIFAADHLNVQGMLQSIFELPEMKDESMKPWMYLSDVQKEKIIELMIPKLWVPVLIHEIGHNLGLRHNFSGSEDKENFYSKEELADMGIEFEAPYRMVYTEEEKKIDDPQTGKVTITPKYMFPYSSVMDYTHSDINALPVMGKYDIAALQFGYARKMNTKSGQKVDVGLTTQLLSDEVKGQLADYMYCSDEGVYLNPTCNRFDEGTNSSEIVEFYIKEYQKNLSRINSKQDRLNFSAFDNFSHFRRKYFRTFFNIRKFFDLFERYLALIEERGIDLSKPENTELRKIMADNYKAVQMSADFMVGIIRTVDAQCKIFNTQSGAEQWVPLKGLGYTSCSQANKLLNKYGWVAISQIGQPLIDTKSADNENIYVDQIDVRGYWIDKLLALETLLKRKHEIQSFDDNLDNYVSMGVKLSSGQTVEAAIADYANELIDGKSKRSFRSISANGELKTETILIDSSEQQFVPNTVSGYFNWRMGLKRGKTHLSRILFQSIVESKGPYDNLRKNKFTKDYLVYQSNYRLENPTLISTDFGDFYFEKDNLIAKTLKEKIELIEITSETSSEVISSIAIQKIEGKTVEQIKAGINESLAKEGEALYANPALKKEFDIVASISQESLKKYVDQKFSEIAEEDRLKIAQHIQTVGTDILIRSSAEIADKGKTGLKIAVNFMLERAPKAEVIEAVAGVENIYVLKSLINQTLNSIGHYKKVLSSMSQIKK